MFTMVMLTLRVLGTLDLLIDAKPITPKFQSDKVRALLVYLALEAGRLHQRRSLAGLLWPDFPERSGLRNLRKALFYLRQTLDQASSQASDLLLIVDRQTIRLNLNNLIVDAVQFEQLLSIVEQHSHRHLHLCQDCLERLFQAATLYRGELFAGFSLPDAFPFEEWLLFWRERLQQQAISALDRLTAAYLERGDNEQGLAYATRQVALDPFREEAHRQVMRLLAAESQYNKALAQYDSFRRLLADELGVEPAAETVALYRKIQAAQRGESLPGVTRKPAVLHYFPVRFTPFIGRETELRQIEELFLDPECRLLTLVGLSGVGKTRLAICASEMLADKGGFADGIYFFSLTAVHSRDLLLTTLVTGLGVALSERTRPQDRLLDYLRQRQCLLVLDNFEQLVESASLLAEILAAAPGLRLLVTSHIPLHLRVEHRLMVAGLTYPAADEFMPDPTAYSAIRLFVESARRADAAFSLNTGNQGAVVQICRLVLGMPLALELAAAWVRVMDCDAIAREIGRSLDFLSLSPQDRPSRHQSMTAVFGYSWKMLTPAEQTVLGQLAVFRGPFSLEAAVTITEATPLALARLLDKSLLQRRKDGRYELHEMLRQFIGWQTGGFDQQVAQQHSDYYLNLVTAQESAFYGPQPHQAVVALQRRLGNIRQAWRWAIAQEHWPAVVRSLEGLGRFYLISALFQEGEAMVALATHRNQSAANLVASLETASSFLVWHAYFQHKQGRHAEAVALTEQALELAGQDEAARAEVHSLLGELLPHVGKFDQALVYLEQAIAYYRATTNLTHLARALQRMAIACIRSGDHEKMLHYTHEAIPVLQALEYKQGLGLMYNLLAGINYELDNLTQALAHIQKAQELYEAIGNKFDEAVVVGNLASIYRRLGRFEQALVANQHAIDINQEIGDRLSLSRDFSNRGLILGLIGEFEHGLDYYYRALEIEKALGNESRIAYFQAGIAAIYQLQGDEETALDYYDLALPVLQAQATPYHLVGPLLGKAELLSQNSEWSAARVLNEQARALAMETELPEFIWQSRLLAARLDFAEGNQAAGRQQLEILLDETTGEQEQAMLYYELWCMSRETALAEAALTCYQRVYQQIPSYVNKMRLEELSLV